MITELPAESTFEDIKQAYDAEPHGTTVRQFLINGKNVLVERKYFWQGKVSRTNYLHIAILDDYRNVVQHWREQKDGNFKTV